MSGLHMQSGILRKSKAVIWSNSASRKAFFEGFPLLAYRTFVKKVRGPTLSHRKSLMRLVLGVCLVFEPVLKFAFCILPGLLVAGRLKARLRPKRGQLAQQQAQQGQQQGPVAGQQHAQERSESQRLVWHSACISSRVVSSRLIKSLLVSSFSSRVLSCLSCLLLSSLVFPCLPLSSLVFHCLLFSSLVFSCLLLSSLVFPCLLLSSLVFPCLLLSSLVFSCFLLSSFVFPCLPLSSIVFSFLPLFSLVFSCLPLSSLVFSCLLLASFDPQSLKLSFNARLPSSWKLENETILRGLLQKMELGSSKTVKTKIWRVSTSQGPGIRSYAPTLFIYRRMTRMPPASSPTALSFWMVTSIQKTVSTYSLIEFYFLYHSCILLFVPLVGGLHEMDVRTPCLFFCSCYFGFCFHISHAPGKIASMGCNGQLQHS